MCVCVCFVGFSASSCSWVWKRWAGLSGGVCVVTDVNVSCVFSKEQVGKLCCVVLFCTM